eukprot:TRINITY_DN7410_c0_g4_i3.p2 TRINITY_DN7410_c0_g4~~TRINITY_DN7410_c0_g4_i3.p2  ORF type:complete len:145 (-),score=65.69 TRINITY_DN7410_c0_g4_i3:26-460(-)
MQTPRFKNLLKQKQMEKREELKREGVKATEAQIDEIEIEIVGAEKPTWHDLFVIQMLVFPYDPIGTFLYYFFHWLFVVKLGGQELTPEELEKQQREELGMDEEEWEEYKSKVERQEEQLKKSNKAKRIRRYMKNRSATFYGGED